jgi:hypothetical protein
MRQLGFWGGAARAAQNGAFRPSGRQNPQLASPRTRPERPEKAGGEGGQSLLPPPLFPGLLGPLEAVVGGLPGEGGVLGGRFAFL